MKINDTILTRAKELDYIDIHVQQRSVTLLFNDNKILILNNGPPENSELLMYSFFIDKTLIAADYMEIDTFIQKFKQYLEL